MAKLTLDISMSLDGFVAGPNQTLDRPLGDGGEQLHEWLFALATFREQHGLSGGETNTDDEVLQESLSTTGAYEAALDQARAAAGDEAGDR